LEYLYVPINNFTKKIYIFFSIKKELWCRVLPYLADFLDVSGEHPGIRTSQGNFSNPLAKWWGRRKIVNCWWKKKAKFGRILGAPDGWFGHPLHKLVRLFTCHRRSETSKLLTRLHITCPVLLGVGEQTLGAISVFVLTLADVGKVFMTKRTSSQLTIEAVSPYFSQSIQTASKKLGVCCTLLKKVCEHRAVKHMRL